MLFIKRLGILVMGGLTLPRALIVLLKSENKSGQRRLEKISTQVSSGQGLAAALSQLSPTLPRATLGLIDIGEKSGRLAESLAWAGNFLEERLRMKNQILSACLYPFLVILTAGVVFGIVLGLLVPKLEPVFRTSQTSLPRFTAWLFWLSLFFRSWWWAIFLSLIILLILTILLLKNASTRAKIFHYLLTFPPARYLLKNHLAALALRTLAPLLASGISLAHALRLAADNLRTNPWGKIYLEAAANVEQGQKFSLSLANKRLSPEFLPAMLAAAEESGKLSETVLTSAAMLENEATENLKRLMALFEPLLLLSLGLVVAGIALAIITPIYGLTQSLSR